MPWNGSGVYSPPGAYYPVVSLTVISSTTRNAMDADLATGISNCITKDGQQTVTANIPMGGFKFTGLGLGTSSTDAASVQNANALRMCEFRLSGVSGSPVIYGGGGFTTLYFTPYGGNRIALFDGTNWNMRSSAEFSIAVPASTNQMYDVFVWDNAGVPTLELLAWTNDTTRATALTTQNGVLSKTGALTRRYVGSIRTTGSSGQIDDSSTKRFIWNYYNRVRRPMNVQDTNTWTYTTATTRQAHGSAANQLDFIVGVEEEPTRAHYIVGVANTNTGVKVMAGLGLDATNVIASSYGNSAEATTAIANGMINLHAAGLFSTGVGRHFIAALEYSAATGTTTWTAMDAGIFQGALFGEISG